jgi:hypothetical protein
MKGEILNHNDLIASLLDQIQSWCNELADHEHCDPIIQRIEADMKEVALRTEEMIESIFDVGVNFEAPHEIKFVNCRVGLITTAKMHEECRRSTMLEF